MKARTFWILGLALAVMAVFVGCGSQARVATGPGPTTLEVIQPPAVQAPIVQAPVIQAPMVITQPYAQAQDTMQMETVTTTTTAPTTQSNPPVVISPVVISEVSTQPADGTWAPVYIPIHELTDAELAAYLKAITFSDS